MSSLCKRGNRSPERLSLPAQVHTVRTGCLWAGTYQPFLSVWGFSPGGSRQSALFPDTRAGSTWEFHSEAVARQH